MNEYGKNHILNALKDGIIVSCQAEKSEPLGKSEILAALAKAVVQGGAVGIRACYPDNIRAIKRVVDIPVIGIIKKQYPDSRVFITPTIDDALKVAAADPDVIAMDTTTRVRPHGESLAGTVSEIRNKSTCLIMADIAEISDAENALALGFDMIGTTLSGYTDNLQQVDPYQPDFQLLEQLVKEFGNTLPIIAEGRIWTPEQVRQAFDLGAYAVVIGSAITRPTLITERFVKSIR